MAHFERVYHLSEFSGTSEDKIRTTGYGDDTDTVAAIAGGLAGLYYGYETIPQEWIAVIKRKEWIEELCRQAEIEYVPF